MSEPNLYWIEIYTGKRYIAIHKGDDVIWYSDTGKQYHRGRKLTQIETALSDEIFQLRETAKKVETL